MGAPEEDIAAKALAPVVQDGAIRDGVEHRATALSPGKLPSAITSTLLKRTAKSESVASIPTGRVGTRWLLHGDQPRVNLDLRLGYAACYGRLLQHASRPINHPIRTLVRPRRAATGTEGTTAPGRRRRERSTARSGQERSSTSAARRHRCRAVVRPDHRVPQEAGRHRTSPTPEDHRDSPATAVLAGSQLRPPGASIPPWCACLRPGLSSGAFRSLTVTSAASTNGWSASGHVPLRTGRSAVEFDVSVDGFIPEQGRQVASVSDRHHWRAGVRAPEHRVPEKQSDIGNPRLREIFFLCSGSQPLPQLITGCQNPAMVLVPARGLEFGRFRSGSSPAMCRPAVIPPANWPTSGGCPRERGHLRRQARGRGRLRCPWRRARGAGPRGEPVGRLRAVLPVARALRSGLARTPCVTGNRRRPSASRSRRELPRPLFSA